MLYKGLSKCIYIKPDEKKNIMVYKLLKSQDHKK